MDNREAKFILSAYRPGGQDAGDRRFAEALEQARRDPILMRWFEESVAFDAVMTKKFSAIQPPAGLRENILTGAKASQSLHRRSALLKWAVAAGFILITGGGTLIWHNTRPAHLAGWQTEALDVISALVRKESSFDAQSHEPTELVAWLRANQAPAAEPLPQSLESLQSLGCKTFSWNGAPVSVICFRRADGGLIHFVAIRAAAAGDRGPKAGPRFVEQGEWTTATWREDDKVYMLAMEGARDQLRAYLL